MGQNTRYLKQKKQQKILLRMIFIFLFVVNYNYRKNPENRTYFCTDFSIRMQISDRLVNFELLSHVDKLITYKIKGKMAEKLASRSDYSGNKPVSPSKLGEGARRTHHVKCKSAPCESAWIIKQSVSLPFFYFPKQPFLPADSCPRGPTCPSLSALLPQLGD